MLFSGKNHIDVVKAREYLDKLISEGSEFEIKKKAGKRSLSQNSYLHLLLSWFSIEYGESVEYVKDNYFKRLCNREIFVEVIDDKYLGKAERLRSSASLDSREMTIAIDRFRNWSSSEAGIYLPSPNEEQFLFHIRKEIERHKEFI